MKILSMDARRAQDRIDAIRLVEVNPKLDERRLRDSLRLIEQRGFHRNQDLAAKLRDVVENCRTG
jgi:hypothetical protein